MDMKLRHLAMALSNLPSHPLRESALEQYSTDGETVTDLPLDAYLEVIRSRASPRAQQLKRHDRILSIHRSGPNTALATVECAMPPRYFVDYLTLMCDGGGWQIISKSFHTNVHE